MRSRLFTKEIDGGALLVIARKSLDIAGFALVFEEDFSGWELSLLMTAPAFWGCGVASSLLTFLNLRLWTQKDNMRACELYDRHGFVLTDNTRYRVESDEQMVEYKMLL